MSYNQESSSIPSTDVSEIRKTNYENNVVPNSEMVVRKHPLPQINTRFPYKINPLYTNELEKKMTNFAIEHAGIMDREKCEESSKCGIYMAYVYQTTDPKRFENMVLFILVHFLFDDCVVEIDDDNTIEHTKLISGQMNKVFEKLLSKEYISLLYCKPIVSAMYFLVEAIFQDLNEVQQKRMAELMKILHDGFIEEVMMRDSINNIKDLEEFIKVRIRCSGSSFGIALIEYDRQIFISEEEWNGDKFQHLIYLYSLHTTLVNDICSYEKETYQHEKEPDYVFNSVQVLSRLEKIDIKESMERIDKMVNEFETEMIALMNEFYNDINVSKDVKIFVNQLEYICGGTVVSHQLLGRYTKF